MNYFVCSVYEISVAVPFEIILVFIMAQKQTFASERILIGMKRTAASINAAHNTFIEFCNKFSGNLGMSAPEELEITSSALPLCPGCRR